MRMNWDMSDAVIYGPLEQEKEMPVTYTLQDQLWVTYLLEQSRWNKEVTNSVLVFSITFNSKVGL